MRVSVELTLSQPRVATVVKAYSSLETTNRARELETGALELTARCIACTIRKMGVVFRILAASIQLIIVYGAHLW